MTKEGSAINDAFPEPPHNYGAGIAPEHKALFARLHRLILQASPDAQVTLSYKMPAYKAGNRRLYVGAWKHGISIYGWQRDPDNEFAARHPELVTNKGTLRLRPDDAARISDEEFLGLARAALAP
jgi:uncharacterized protein YdhG (YjbR/CyaY superfamily)